MSQITELLAPHWFAAALVGLALVPAAWLLIARKRAGAWSISLALLAGGLVLAGAGGLLISPTLGGWLAIGAVAVWFVLVFVMVLTGHWWAPAGYALLGLLLFGVGAAFADTAGEGLEAAFAFVRNLRPLQPWWLLLLLLIPIIILLSFRSLAGLGPVRRWIAIGLRCALVLFLTLALAEAATTTQPDTTTVLYVLDGSQSVPKELVKRAERFINDAVEYRGAGHERDKSGLIVFGKQPRLERPPSDAPVLKFKYEEVAESIDDSYTNIAAALKLALASFPEGSGKRIVLISDGNENLGSAEEQAQRAKAMGVQIDVVPLATGQRNQNEVLVERIEAPGLIEQGSQVPIRVQVRSYNPNIVVGTLSVTQIKDGQGQPVPDSPRQVALLPGVNTFTFKQLLTEQQQSYTYQAEFTPLWVQDDKGNVLFKGLPGDRVENNLARTHVVARGRRRILLVQQPAREGKPREHDFLAQRLAEAGNRKFQVVVRTADELPKDRDQLALMLSDFDCAILADVPADMLSEQQMEVLRSNTHDQGCGLIMIGGPDSFGAGGWQKTPVEKALPVDCDINSLKVQGKGGLVLIMHASEMADGNFWQKKIAKLAVERLAPVDEIGVIHFDWGINKWHIPLQEIGEKRGFLMGQIDKMQPGDMPEVDTALQMAHKELTDPARELVTKHVIFISDGDPQQTNANILAQMKRDKVTVTTVGVATHGAPQDQAMTTIATRTGGRYHKVSSPAMLPAIYIKETRLVSQSFVYESKRGFQPGLSPRPGPVEGLPRPLPPLYGFVRTTLKPNVLVEHPIMTPQFAEQDFPVLAYWHYGLGKGVAFTSDARQIWDKAWAGSEMYSKFWEQVLDWSLRPVESKRLVMTTEYRDGKVRVIVEARRDDGEPDVRLLLRGGVTIPGGKAEEGKMLKFEQKNSGVYVAEFKAEEAGSYFIDAAAVVKEQVKDKDGKVIGEREVPVDSVRAGVTIPYSPEFADMEANTGLLERVRELTDGKAYPEDEAGLAAAARSGEIYRPGVALAKSLQPIWYWLIFTAAVLLLFDVAVRRIAVDPVQVVAGVQAVWDRLRGTVTPSPQAAEFFDRLQSRKAQVGGAMQRGSAARRFEAGEGAVATAPPGADEAAPPPRQAPRPAGGPRPPAAAEEEAGDFASRLMRAKQRAMEERQKRKEGQ